MRGSESLFQRLEGKRKRSKNLFYAIVSLRRAETDLLILAEDLVRRTKVTHDDVMKIDMARDSVLSAGSWPLWKKIGSESDEIGPDLADKTRSVIETIEKTLTYVKAAVDSCVEKGVRYIDDECTEALSRMGVKYEIKNLGSQVKNLTGKECGDLVTWTEEKGYSYDLPYMLLDIGRCIMELEDWLFERWRGGTEDYIDEWYEYIAELRYREKRNNLNK